MLTKNEIKDIQSLYQKKQRQSEGLFIAEGPKLASEIIGSDYEVVKIYATAKWLQNNSTGDFPFAEIGEQELARISQLQTSNEIVVVVKQKTETGYPSFKNNVTLLLDGIQDPGNMGTIIRTADWFGLSQIICTPDCADIYNPKVVQSTMGSIVRVSCWYRDAESLEIPDGIRVYGAMLHGQSIYNIEKINEGILVIGNESKGIREPVASKISHPVTIPRSGGAESLNVAVATGIIVSQMTRANQ